MFFNPNDFRRRQERTGPSGLLEIFSREWLTIVKVDALTCLSLVPLVTLPPALLAMNHMSRRMAEDRSVTVREFWQSFRTNFWRSYPTFFLAVLLPVISLWSSFFYAGQAVRQSFALGFARPGQALMCALLNDCLAVLAIGFLPFSIPYFLLGGLMFPCVAGQVIVRPVLDQFCPDLEGEEEEEF